MPYLTPNTLPSGTICRTVLIPDHIDWLVIVNGAFSELIKPERFEQFGAITPEETANRFEQMFFEFRDSECNPVTPIGFVGDWMTDTPPDGWLICDGQSVSRTTYADLFALWGDAFGAGDGTTTFNLPDFRFRSPIGAGSNFDDTVNIGVGGQYGTETATLTEAELPTHNHSINDPQHNHSINDPGHVHAPLSPSTSFLGNKPSATNTAPVGTALGAAATTASNNTGIGINMNDTGITINNTGDGLPFSIVHPVLGVNRIVYTGVGA
jgi:microcystin-dependent protein